ncbi:MAG: glycosyl transferase, family 2 [Solirubrobacterales bacterium]|nr:glycosyl transferase, family 2 [Solirubrobacterales bacterium]
MDLIEPRPVGAPPSASTDVWDRTRAETSIRHPSDVTVPRVVASGKFLWAGPEKLYVKGVTYGPFAPGVDPQGFNDPVRVDGDFAAMAEAGVNTVRVYDAPAGWLLDLAAAHKLLVIAGLAWEQHVAFLDDPGRAKAIVRRVRSAVADCAGHRALLAWAIGNEIPSDVVRWHGRRPVERFLHRLADEVRRADPTALVTYASYPSTEYLDLPFLDFLSFNVFLEQPARFEAYLARLQNIAGERPLLLTEVGLDAARHGERAQADALHDQLRVAFGAGCAGAVVFSWTDEWHRGGADVEGWAFGLTRRDASAKPAIDALRDAYCDVPFAPGGTWPRVSIVVCSHNGAATIENCLEGIGALDYPDYEAIVVDDGSTDTTAAIAGRFTGVKLIRTENRGLSAARNTGLDAASGDIIAYLDDDARPDAHWLRYLVRSFRRSDHVGIGGPNIQPPAASLMARAIAAGPGGPIHVLLSDTVAEHIPGCNMAFRREALEAIGGFDPRFRVAGDDVDVCWRLQERGWTLGFSPAAVVDHRARTTLRGYCRQQRGYGRAEALLERKWPERYNGGGHVTWAGRVYGSAAAGHRHRRWRVYYGPQGSGLFQHAHDRAPGRLATLPLMPEWYLLLALLALFAVLPVLGTLGGMGSPVRLALLPLALACAGTAARAGVDAWRVVFGQPGITLRGARRRWALTMLIHLVQPPARLAGRLEHGLAPWRGSPRTRFALPMARTRSHWYEPWADPASRRAAVEEHLRGGGFVVRAGGPYDRWDLELRTGALARARALLVVEEHGQGRQRVRTRVLPHVSVAAVLVVLVLEALGFAAGSSGAWVVAAALAFVGTALGALTLRDAAAAVGTILDALEAPPTPEPVATQPRGVRSQMTAASTRADA